MPNLEELLSKALQKEGKGTTETKKTWSRGNRPDRLYQVDLRTTSEEVINRTGSEEVAVMQPIPAKSEITSTTGTGGSGDPRLYKPAPKTEEQVEKTVRTEVTGRLPQSKSATEDLSSAKAPEERIEPDQEGGFFKLPHQIFADANIRELTGNERWVLLFLASRAWRFESSDGNTRASVRYLQELLGMQKSSLQNALKTLQDKKFIDCIKTDLKIGNTYSVSKTFRYSAYEKTTPHSSRRSAGATGIWGAEVQAYLLGLGSGRKEREVGMLDSLLLEHPGETREIERALLYVLNKGDLRGNPVQSPVGLLRVSYSEIRDFIRAEHEKKGALDRKLQAQLEKERLEREEDERADIIQREREEAFLREFPTEEKRQEILQRYEVRHSFPLPMHVKRSLAIGEWWRNRG